MSFPNELKLIDLLSCGIDGPNYYLKIVMILSSYEGKCLCFVGHSTTFLVYSSHKSDKFVVDLIGTGNLEMMDRTQFYPLEFAARMGLVKYQVPPDMILPYLIYGRKPDPGLEGNPCFCPGVNKRTYLVQFFLKFMIQGNRAG
jgi:hypothetical protein